MRSKTKKRLFTICASILLSIFVLGFVANDAEADIVRWERIVGIIEPGENVGEVVDGTPAPWTVTDGTAVVDLDEGKIRFKVRGLVVASDPSFANIGTTTVVTKVKGTLVCNETDGAEIVDTKAVPLSAKGDAKFFGTVDLPSSCIDEPGDLVFLIRIAEVVSGFEFLIDRWNAFAAVRIRVANQP